MLEHLIHDIRFLNNNANAGIYAHAYLHNSKIEPFISKDKTSCLQYVKDNFDPMFEKNLNR